MSVCDVIGEHAPLSGLTVLDLSHVLLGPYCTMLMCRHGADVIKIEPPGGDPMRMYRSGSGFETASVALFNAGKRGLCLDLKQSRGRDIFLQLVRDADVVVENFGPGTLERLGLAYETLSEQNPRIILASGRGYGQTGPYRDYLAMDLIIQAINGVLTTTGFAENPPVKAGVPIADMTGGIHLFSAISLALYQRQVTGVGQHVSISMHDALLPTLSSPLAAWLDSGGTQPERTGNRHSGLAVSPYNVYRARDGWIAILGLTDAHWRSLCRVMELDELESKPGWSTNQERVERMDEVDQLISDWTSGRSKREVFVLLANAGVPAAPVQNLGEVLKDPQVRAQGMLQVAHDSQGREVVTFGSPLRFSKAASVPPAMVPSIGGDTDQVLTEKLCLQPAEIAELHELGVV